MALFQLGHATTTVARLFRRSALIVLAERTMYNGSMHDSGSVTVIDALVSGQGRLLAPLAQRCPWKSERGPAEPTQPAGGSAPLLAC